MLSRLSAKSDVVLWKVFIFHLAASILMKKHDILFGFLHFVLFTPLLFALKVNFCTQVNCSVFRGMKDEGLLRTAG